MNYTTSFPLTENPINESGSWTNGLSNGEDWCDVRTTSGRAIGTQDGSGGYDDSTAICTGTWGADVEVSVVAYVNAPAGLAEIEIRLRSVITAGVNRGYEVLFAHDGDYAQIVRWNGPVGNFTYLNVTEFNGGEVALHTGDVIKATIVGGTINAYVNDVLYMRATDNTWTDGNPGFGFYIDNSTNGTVGITDFTATDGQSNPPVGTPVLSVR